jgi:hypothetical protein
MKITIITNTFQKYHRQNIAVESWLYLKALFSDMVDIKNLQFTDEKGIFTNEYENIPTHYILKNSSRTFIPNSFKKLPVFFEMISKGFEISENSEYIIYVNSDVILLPRLISYIQNHKPDCMAGSRIDISHITSFNDVLEHNVVPIRNEIAGFDFFVFKKGWFQQYEKELNSQFVIGKPLFDVDYAGLMVLLGNNFHIANTYPMMALHIYHGNESVTTECPEKEWNYKVHEDNLLFKIANNIIFYNLQTNLCKRTPWGTFMNPNINEQETQSVFFNTMNIHHVNNIEYIKQ